MLENGAGRFQRFQYLSGVITSPSWVGGAASYRGRLGED
jgi:hypothetical protein